MKITSHKFKILALVCFVGLAGCDNPNTAQGAGKKIDQTVKNTESKMDKAAENMNEAREKTEVNVGDTSITSKIKTAFLAESTIKSLDINVSTSDGVVTLTGTADSLASKEKAGEIAGVISEVKHVNNEIVIK